MQYLVDATTTRRQKLKDIIAAASTAASTTAASTTAAVSTAFLPIR
jgi:hypothetical protein